MAVRTLTGAVTWVDTAQAQFDRDVHRGSSYPIQRLPAPSQCVDAMPAVALVPGQIVNVYDGVGFGHRSWRIRRRARPGIERVFER